MFRPGSSLRSSRRTHFVILLSIALLLLIRLTFLIFQPLPEISEEVWKNPPPFRCRAPTPKKIWQTWREPLADLDEPDMALARTWTALNRGYRHEWLVDAAAHEYVQHAEGISDEIRGTYMQISDPILKADLLRYLIIYLEGGVYADMDTEARKPVDEWIPRQICNETAVSGMRKPILTVGVERYFLDSESVFGVDTPFCFSQYVFAADARHPVLLDVLSKSVRAIHDVARRQNCSISRIVLSRLGVLQVTGPTLWTNSIMSHLYEGYGVSHADIMGAVEPMLVGDVVILPIRAFGAGQHHSNAGACYGDDVLVCHHFHGSWLEDHPMPTSSSDL